MKGNKMNSEYITKLIKDNNIELLRGIGLNISTVTENVRGEITEVANFEQNESWKYFFQQ
ncbi:hypothetical protein ACFOEK_10715 [Litoribrevibacter euphylliae]|uniref:Uncharacterized protein n=1 Tax=Litoribrevibacter euphylliae TaxID=1834034 RepID=A0ABV7HFV2_9GAMM